MRIYSDILAIEIQGCDVDTRNLSAMTRPQKMVYLLLLHPEFLPFLTRLFLFWTPQPWLKLFSTFMQNLMWVFKSYSSFTNVLRYLYVDRTVTAVMLFMSWILVCVCQNEVCSQVNWMVIIYLLLFLWLNRLLKPLTCHTVSILYFVAFFFSCINLPHCVNF